jgi:hypothetical protein
VTTAALLGGDVGIAAAAPQQSQQSQLTAAVETSPAHHCTRWQRIFGTCWP